MAYAADNRDARRENGVSDDLLVKGPQVLQAPAAPADNDDIDEGISSVHASEGGCNLLCGALALHADRTDPYLDRGPAPTQDLEHVTDRRSRRTGDQRNAPGETRQGPFARQFKIAQR